MASWSLTFMSITIRDLICSHHRKTFSGTNIEFTVHGHSKKKRFEKHWSMLYPLLLCGLVQDIISHGAPLTSLGGLFHRVPDLRHKRTKNQSSFCTKCQVDKLQTAGMGLRALWHLGWHRSGDEEAVTVLGRIWLKYLQSGLWKNRVCFSTQFILLTVVNEKCT